MNLVIADSAKASKDAVGYFGYVQKLFTFFFRIYTTTEHLVEACPSHIEVFE